MVKDKYNLCDGTGIERIDVLRPRPVCMCLSDGRHIYRLVSNIAKVKACTPNPLLATATVRMGDGQRPYL